MVFPMIIDLETPTHTRMKETEQVDARYVVKARGWRRPISSCLQRLNCYRRTLCFRCRWISTQTISMALAGRLYTWRKCILYPIRSLERWRTTSRWIWFAHSLKQPFPQLISRLKNLFRRLLLNIPFHVTNGTRLCWKERMAKLLLAYY